MKVGVVKRFSKGSIKHENKVSRTRGGAYKSKKNFQFNSAQRIPLCCCRGRRLLRNDGSAPDVQWDSRLQGNRVCKIFTRALNGVSLKRWISVDKNNLIKVYSCHQECTWYMWLQSCQIRYKSRTPRIHAWNDIFVLWN